MLSTLTQEQSLILKAFASGDSFKVNAYAGTGKTFTLRALAEAHPNKRFLYVGFNRRIVEEASAIFPTGYVHCKTAHQLAYAKVPSHVRERITPDTRLLLKALIQWVQTESHLGKFTEVSHVCEHVLLPALHQFKQSDHGHIPALKALYPPETLLEALQQQGIKRYLQHLAKHPQCREKVSLPSDEKSFTPDTLEALALIGFQGILTRFWHAQFAPESTLPLDHDSYLKAWQLTHPKLPFYDAILFDEAQDANPCMLSIVMAQTHCQKVVVGDRFQQLYAWRGAVNSLKTLDMPEYYLTQTFRFGASLATLSTQVLQAIDPETPPLSSALDGIAHTRGSTHTSIRRVNAEEYPRTVLCRTNAALLNYYLQYYESCHIEIVGREEFTMASELEGHFRAFKRLDETAWKALKLETKEETPQSFKLMLWVEKHQAMIPEVLKHLKQSAKRKTTQTPSEQSRKKPRKAVVLSTVHQAKGLEWDYVVLGDDFKTDSHDELNILYVALTRAKRVVDVSDCSALDALGITLPTFETTPSNATKPNDSPLIKVSATLNHLPSRPVSKASSTKPKASIQRKTPVPSPSQAPSTKGMPVSNTRSKTRVIQY
ncbi:MAG: ATP-binding domain-containing protein [Vampirovibrionales bacterium]